MPKRKGGARPKNQPKSPKSNSEEAIEDRFSVASEDINEDEEPSGEDLDENIEKDYEEIPELDKYEEYGIDEQEYAKMPLEERRKIDKVLEERDRRRGRGRQVGGRVLGSMINALDELDDEVEEAYRIKRKKMMAFGQPGLIEEEYQEITQLLDNKDIKGNEGAWLQEERTIRYIREDFKKFCKKFKISKMFLYFQCSSLRLYSPPHYLLKNPTPSPTVSTRTAFVRWVPTTSKVLR